jgi:hypothetical protein
MLKQVKGHAAKAEAREALTTVVVNEVPVRVILHPPSKSRKSWYASWTGLVTSVSTGERDLDSAVVAAKRLVENGVKRGEVQDTGLSNEEFEAIQKAHFAKKKDPKAQVRAAKSLKGCLEAIEAFQLITGLDRISGATPDDCARFQREALQRPKNWRQKHPNSKEEVATISPNTVAKWPRSLQAAFERANRHAGATAIHQPRASLRSPSVWSSFTPAGGA